MFRIVMLSVLLVLLPLNSVSAFNRLDVFSELSGISSNWDNVKIDVWVNDLRDSPDPSLYIGDTLDISVSSDVSGYFALIHVDNLGETTIIRPAQTTRSRLSFPETGTFEWVQGPPVGAQSIFVLQSDSPFPVSALGIDNGEEFAVIDPTESGIKKFVSTVNTQGNSHKLALSERYQYYANSRDIQLTSRGLVKMISTQRSQVDNRDPASEQTAEQMAAELAKETGAIPFIDDEKPAAEQPELPAVRPPKDEFSSASYELNLQFEFDSDVLTDEDTQRLDLLANAILESAESAAGLYPLVSLEGHTDSTGEESYNFDLSMRRADSARSYLITQYQIPTDRIETVGLGETDPLVPNNSAEARAKNRRVELRLLQDN